MGMTSSLRREVQRVIHEDLRRANVLWNDELNRALIINFHQSKLDPRPSKSRAKRKSYRTESPDGKRLRVL
ncbi:hypothetical protein N7517_003501 [Penicillium concentricum]|uniref:Uncharacterized protein n=1 Tax=Penicillium concentricum TaxID=293559 RepID=A0A9W9VM06_9EURO|nr:uncharacterized protein N7517_003501 [Penicillium concentricum]KAJ5385590.1 hypothetical protein N7517_003501 [Penicillium concentricum]